MPNSHYMPYALCQKTSSDVAAKPASHCVVMQMVIRVYKFPEGRLRSCYSTRIFSAHMTCRPTLSCHSYLQWSMKRLQLAMCCSEVGCHRREHDSQINDLRTAVMLWISLYRPPVLGYCYVPTGRVNTELLLRCSLAWLTVMRWNL